MNEEANLERRLVYLEGRLGATDLLLRSLLAIAVENSTDEPLRALAQFKQQFLQSLQHLERDEGEHGDAVWEVTSEELARIFDSFEKRFKDVHGV